LIQFLNSKGIDARSFNYLKQGFVKKDHKSLGYLTTAEFIKIFEAVFKQARQEQSESMDQIISYITSERSQDEVSFDKLSTLVEVYSYYPLIVKKDKNASSEVYRILNGNKKHAANVRNYSLDWGFSRANRRHPSGRRSRYLFTLLVYLSSFGSKFLRNTLQCPRLSEHSTFKM
jgi:hypothetical protein